MNSVHSFIQNVCWRPIDSSFGLRAAALSAPILLLYAPLAMALVLPVSVVLAIMPGIFSRKVALRFDVTVTLLLFSFIAVAAVSYFWAYQPQSVIEKLPRTALTVAMGLLFLASAASLEPADRQRVAVSLVAGVAVAFTAIALERIFSGILLPMHMTETNRAGFLNQFNRPLAILSILLWPAVACIGKWRPLFGIGLVALALVGSLFYLSAAATLAVAVGAAAALFTAFLPRAGFVLLATVMSGAILFAPVIERNLPPPKTLLEEVGIMRSSYHRLIIWRFVNARIDERPLLGWGFNQSRNIPGNTNKVGITEVALVALPLHPHNAAFQWRLELGLLGALLGTGLFVTALDRARKSAKGRIARGAAAGAITAAFTVAMVSFGIWQTWWVSSLFLATGFCIVACSGKDQARDVQRRQANSETGSL